jgi:hypothetical protein
VLLALSAALAACVPAPYGTYLRPSYPDASAVLTRAECGGQAGPPKNLSFSAPGEVKLMVSARRNQGEPAAGWLLSIRIEPPAGSGFRFVSDTVEVASSAGAAGDRLRPKVLATSSQQLPANAWIDIARLGPTSQDIAAQALAAEAGLEVGVARAAGDGGAGAPQRLRVVLPALQTARQRIEVPPLELSADASASGVQTLRSADYAQALAQREARCRAQTPERACENIGKHDPYSFRHESGPFTYLGRFWNFVGETPQPLRFELEVQARTTESWRIVEPILRLQEGADGTSQQRALDRVNVTLRYPVPLDTRLRGAGAAMLIELALPASHSRHFVQLPSYDVNGLRYRLQPIELEQRRFDGGIEPFNC